MQQIFVILKRNVRVDGQQSAWEKEVSEDGICYSFGRERRHGKNQYSRADGEVPDGKEKQGGARCGR
jgi:hypothetical protein